MSFSLRHAVRLTLLLSLLAYACYLAGTYFWPLVAPVPTLEGGLINVGHVTDTEQIMWIQCNKRCRNSKCAQLEADADAGAQQQQPPHSLEACISAIRPVMRVRQGGASAWLPSASHISPRAPLTSIPLVNVTVLHVRGLQPCTLYEYDVRMQLSDTEAAAEEWSRLPSLGSSTFRTAPRDGEAGCEEFRHRAADPTTTMSEEEMLHHLHDRGASPSAVSSPAASSPVLRMLWGSCLGISPFSDLRVFSWLNGRPERTDAVLLLGDTVYVDIPALEDSVAYAHTFGDPALGQLVRSVPLYGMFDDHEITNDWTLAHPHGHEGFHRAMRFFDEWVAGKNPSPPLWDEAVMGPMPPNQPPLASTSSSPSVSAPPLRSFELDPSLPTVRPRYFHFQRGKHAAFFVVDTREYATPLPPIGPSDPRERTKLGQVQLAHLKHWLLNCKATFKFLASPVAWTAAAFKFVQDGWGSYLPERDALFDFIVAHNITGVVLLSADLHWAGVFHLQRWNMHEVTVSPLQSFGLPHWIEGISGESREYSSTFAQHAGQIEVYEEPTTLLGGDATNGGGGGVDAILNISIFRYHYGEPRRHRSVIWRASEMVHRAVEVSKSRHEEPAPCALCRKPKI